MEKLQAVKGMNDILPGEIAKWQHVERKTRELLEVFGYREIRTPLVEYTPLFSRGIGEQTDIVEKEMYTFEDRDGRKLSLRPEGTASAARAYVEHSIFAHEPSTRWYYSGPMFRHERAQRGRYRQFYQIGCEVFGIAEPTVDAEMMAMVVALFSQLGVGACELRVNCVGDPQERGPYRAALLDYFRAHLGSLCADCQRRLEKNPMRILDCKQEACQALARGAPSMLDYLTEPSKAQFEAVRAHLTRLGVVHYMDPQIVRGLDYYTGTVFELVGHAGSLGAQNTLCAGGRYDGLVEQLGGPKTPAAGFAFGLERVVMALPQGAESFSRAPDLFLVTHGASAHEWALTQAHTLRLAGIHVDVSHEPSSFRSQMKRADRSGARFALLVGEAELEQGIFTLRDMQNGTERKVAQAELSEDLLRSLGYGEKRIEVPPAP